MLSIILLANADNCDVGEIFMHQGRRRFLGQVGGITLVTALGGLDACAQTPRKQVAVAGKNIKVVDIHAHCVFPELADMLSGTNLDHITFRDFVALSPARIEAMDQRGIDVQALSVNAFWWYEADRPLASKIVALQDQRLAEWCDKYAGRFVALTSPALQFPDLAAEQLEFAVKELGSRGASVGGHVHNDPPSSEFYDPFWAKAEELDVPVFMHPNNAMNIVRDGGLAGRGNLGNIIGNPLETTVFLTHMIFDGALDRFPRLKICAAHGGGFLPSYLGRTDVACSVRPAADCANERPVRDYFKDQILVDSMVFSAEALRHLVAETAASQVVYGSDMPYNWPDTLELIVDSPDLTDREKMAILGGNLTTLLNL